MTDDDRIDALEYVLGLTSEAERRQFELALLDDPALADEVWRAEAMLAPFAGALPERKPSPRVLKNIEKSLFPDASVVRRGTPVALAFWRSLASVLGAAAVGGFALAAVLIVRPGVILSDEALVAALVGTTADGGGITLARLQRDGTLVTAPFGENVAPDRDPELWLVIEGTAPVSLGLLEANQGSRIRLPRESEATLLDAQLVVTAEPEGGSPTGGPTGPALAVGGFQSL